MCAIACRVDVHMRIIASVCTSVISSHVPYVSLPVHLISTRNVAPDLVGRRSYARSTTSRAIKNNLPLAQAGGDLNATARRAHQIIDTHQRLQRLHKDAEPDRYGINPRGPSGHGTLSGKEGPRGIAWDNAM